MPVRHAPPTPSDGTTAPRTLSLDCVISRVMSSLVTTDKCSKIDLNTLFNFFYLLTHFSSQHSKCLIFSSNCILSFGVTVTASLLECILASLTVLNDTCPHLREVFLLISAFCCSLRGCQPSNLLFSFPLFILAKFVVFNQVNADNEMKMCFKCLYLLNFDFVNVLSTIVHRYP